MKPVHMLFCLSMINYSLAQRTAPSEQRIKDNLKLELLLESSETTRTCDLYSKKVDEMEAKMDAVEDKIDVVEYKINAIEDKIDVIYSLLTEEKPCNCVDLMRKNSTLNGVYTIYARENSTVRYQKQIQVYCDMETDGGGWLVFQRRTDGSVDFHRQWFNYKNGFGDMKNNFWLGNEDMYQILKCGGSQHEVRIELEDFSNETRYAKYSNFNIGSSADNYRLTMTGYTGNAGNDMEYLSGSQFSTYDRDTDSISYLNCAEKYKGGWWYKDCHLVNLNGLYLNGSRDHSNFEGIVWPLWKGSTYSLKFTEMKFRPKH